MFPVILRPIEYRLRFYELKFVTFPPGCSDKRECFFLVKNWCSTKRLYFSVEILVRQIGSVPKYALYILAIFSVDSVYR